MVRVAHEVVATRLDDQPLGLAGLREDLGRVGRRDNAVGLPVNYQDAVDAAERVAQFELLS